MYIAQIALLLWDTILNTTFLTTTLLDASALILRCSPNVRGHWWDFTFISGHLNQVLHNPQAVAFTAQLSHDMTNIGANQPVVFDHVVTKPGNSFDKTTGHFMAPQNGMVTRCLI